MRVMGTGSRSMLTRKDAREIYAILQYKIEVMLEQHPDLVLISGMAEGWDEAIAKIGMREHIPYEVYLPNPGYGEYYWGRRSLTGKNRMNMFNKLCGEAEEIHFSMTNGKLYDASGRHANFVRNDDMVATSDYALVFQPTSSGTKDAVKTLKMKKVPYEVYPFDQGVLF